MDVDQSSSELHSTEEQNHREDDLLSSVRGPPTFSGNEGDIPSDFSSPSMDVFTMKNQWSLELNTLKRKLQEVKNAANMNTQKSDVAMVDIQAMKKTVTKLESRLGPLQKMAASQMDKTTALKKEVQDTDTANKLQITEQTKKIEEISTKQRELESKFDNLSRKVEQNSNQRSSGFGQSNAALPENLMQMIDAFERQLGMYDVRIAEMDLRFQVLENTSYTGVLVWKINDYQRRKREALTGRNLSLYSQPFYTSRYGYKMCARIYLNGDGMGKGTHLSLFFVVMKGEYDSLLPWPFRQKVTLILLDQGPDRKHLTDTFRPDPSSSSFKRPTSDMNIASGCPLFVAHNVIDGSSYVKDDTIYVRIQVDTTDLENF